MFIYVYICLYMFICVLYICLAPVLWTLQLWWLGEKHSFLMRLQLWARDGRAMPDCPVPSNTRYILHIILLVKNIIYYTSYHPVLSNTHYILHIKPASNTLYICCCTISNTQDVRHILLLVKYTLRILHSLPSVLGLPYTLQLLLPLL